SRSCEPSRPSRYFNSATVRPHSDLQLRPSMLLAAKDVAMAEAMIRRGVASDHTLGLRGAPDVHAHYLITKDKARSVRAPLFPAPGRIAGFGVEVHVEQAEVLEGAERLLLYETGKVRVDKLDTLQWVPGGLADHLTSFGGRLDGKYGQMSALEWIASGATGSYGTVSEPCSHPQKFPHPQIVLLHYVQGATLIEAYWKSVAWPQQGLFIGEPLAAPFPLR
ncbi:MAG: TIGR03790 family protein, partial [Burkholderiaceae bacterium]|nr:TIGR03790 family protein [Burkholderiaceae bacterium]